MLRDPNYNQLEVQVERIDDNVTFKNGWFELRDFYNIDIGAWILLTYEHPTLMTMSVFTRFDEEIEYPHHTLPITSRLDRRWCEGGSMSYANENLVTLSASDVHSGYVVNKYDMLCTLNLIAFFFVLMCVIYTYNAVITLGGVLQGHVTSCCDRYYCC